MNVFNDFFIPHHNIHTSALSVAIVAEVVTLMLSVAKICWCHRCLVSRTAEEHPPSVAVPRSIQQRLIVGEYMNTPEDQSYRKSLGNAIRVIAEMAEHSNVVEVISAKQWVLKNLADNKETMKLRERGFRGRRRKSDDNKDKKYGSASVYWVGFTPFQ